MIYLKLMGRIGNQLFMYAAARTLQENLGGNQEIVIEDYQNYGWDGYEIKYENSLVNYDLPNVRHVHDLSIWKKSQMLIPRIVMRILTVVEGRLTPRQVYNLQRKLKKLMYSLGIVHLTDGFEDLPKKQRKHYYLNGYFQSEKYFYPIKDEIIDYFSLDQELLKIDYPNLQKIKDRNTVCISIKVQHNVGNPMYDVCNDGYYERAIQEIVKKVDDPLFFVCSDNVDYVLNNLVDVDKYDYVTQDASFPVHISLAVMAKSKHFIIGNTSFGWWAQFLSRHPDKIVIAPSRWYGTDVPCDIYQENWHTIIV